MSTKYRVIERATGHVHYLTAEELAHIPQAEARRAARWPAVPGDLSRALAIKLIRTALRKRSGKAWSVTGGRGTGYGWLRIDAPPARRKYDADGNPTSSSFGYMGLRDREELTKLLGLKDLVHFQGEQVPASDDFRREYIARARGLKPTVYGTQYWD